MRAADIPVDPDALDLCRLLLRAAETDPPAPALQGIRPRKPTLMERLDRWFADARERDRERYLAQAHDGFDLEARIRVLEQQPYY